MSNTLKKNIPFIVAALVLWIVLAFFNNAYLYKNGELSLFLFDWSFIKDSFHTPGGFLNLAGAFFTQFLLIPWLGALLWVILLYIAGVMTVRAFSIPAKLTAIAFIPVAALVIANMSLGYGLFMIRCNDHFFAPTIGYITILAIVSVTGHFQKAWEKIIILIASAAAGFILTGVFGLVGVAVAGLATVTAPRTSDNEHNNNIGSRLTALCISIALCIAVPLVCYRLFTSFNISYYWKLGLTWTPVADWTNAIQLPVWCLFGFTGALALLQPLFQKAENRNRKLIAVNPTIAVIAILATFFFWFKDANFKTEMKMSLAAEQYDWKKVVDIYRKASISNIDTEEKTYRQIVKELDGDYDDESYARIFKKYSSRIFNPTRYMVVLRDIALLKQGKALDRAFAYRDGNMPQKSKYGIIPSLETGPQVFFNYGLVNLEYHWCLERQAISDWSYSTLKYMAMYAVIMNEPEFADKFLDKLDKTLFFHKWSREQRALSGNPKAVSNAMPYKEIIPYMCFYDRMAEFDDGDYEVFLINHYFKNHSQQSTSEFDRAALLWAMRYKDIAMFWKAFDQYLDTTKDTKLPKHVQEAALLFCNIEQEDLGLPFDKEVMDKFIEFNKYLQKDGFSKDSPVQAWKKFGDTYYYYYYMCNIYSFRL